jgi:hypothetical protein
MGGCTSVVRVVDTVTAGRVEISVSQPVRWLRLSNGGMVELHLERFKGGTHHPRCNVRCSIPLAVAAGEAGRPHGEQLLPPTYMWVQFLARTIERRRPRGCGGGGGGDDGGGVTSRGGVVGLTDEDGEDDEVYFYHGVGQDYWVSRGRGYFDTFTDVVVCVCVCVCGCVCVWMCVCVRVCA